MKYSLTIFKNTFDNKTHRSMEVDSWDAFEGLLYGMSRKEGEKGATCPSHYIKDTTRSNASFPLFLMLMIFGWIGMNIVIPLMWLQL